MNKLFFKYLIELWQYIETKRRKQFFFIFFLMLLASISELISIGAIIPFLSVITSPDILYSNVHLKPLIQFLQIKNSQDLILPITILFALTATISGIIRLLLLWAQTKFAYGLVADFSINIYRRTLYQPYFIHISRNSSDIISGITSKSSYLTHQCIVPLITIISSGLILLSIMSLLVIIDPYMAISTFFGFGCIYLILSIVTKNKLIQASEVINSDTSLVIKTLQEGLGGIRDILIDGSQETYLNHFKKAEIRLRNALSKVSNISASPRFGIESLGMVMISIVAYLLAKRQEGLTSAIPLLGVLAMGAQRLLPLLQQVYGSLTTMRGSMASLRETLFLLKQPLPQELNNSKIHNINFNKQIKLNNVTFKYGNNLPIILNEINMIFTKGSRIGFIGSTGSGKSTLLDIIMGLLEPTSGFLEIDGLQIDTTNCRMWQSQIAHVPQTIFLTDGTISENIAFGIPENEIKMDRIIQAAKSANIHETIMGFEKKYQTIVGERGVRLSGGQRQRIGIARALYKKADVIIFDEATSALDSKTEDEVMESIKLLGSNLTIFIVAHRLTTLKICDKIYEFSNNRLTRSGSYSEIVG